MSFNFMAAVNIHSDFGAQENKVSFEVNLHLVFIKFAVGKVDEYSQVAPNILTSFPVTESSICFFSSVQFSCSVVSDSATP